MDEHYTKVSFPATLNRAGAWGHTPQTPTAGLAAIFATPIVAGTPDALTTNLALLAFVNRIAIGRCIPRPPVRSIILIIPMPPIIPMMLITLITLIRGHFNA
jgi:hypothetical protein